MAIKTKKISDLSVIPQSGLDTSVLLGMNSGVTGQIKFGDVMKKVDEHIDNKLANQPSTVQAVALVEEEPVSNEQIVALQGHVSTLKSEIADVAAAHKSLNKKYTSYATSNTNVINDLTNQIYTLNEKVSAIESFLQALQKDGYLTLKEIQKAAAEACPICTHTHEESAE